MNVIFGTSGIQVTHPVYKGQPISAISGSEFYYSTGKFEQALREGCSVWVVSTRAALGPHDVWWQMQIPVDRILLSQNGDCMAPWRELFARLKLPFPEACAHWTHIANRLPSFDLFDGRTLKGHDIDE